jgi:hypothetical protein
MILYNQLRKICFSDGSEYDNYGLLGCDSVAPKYGGSRSLETLMPTTKLHCITSQEIIIFNQGRSWQGPECYVLYAGKIIRAHKRDG